MEENIINTCPQKPYYDEKVFQFVCLCKGRVELPSLARYKSHCQTKGHKYWVTEKKITGQIVAPICKTCFDPMHEPLKHQSENCSQLVNSLAEKFQQKVDATMEKFTTCNNCQKILILTTLCRVKKWKEQYYCISCFAEHYQKEVTDNTLLVTRVLLHDNNGFCPLCDQVILPTDQTIFEHMNPFAKTAEPTKCLEAGISSIQVIRESRQQGVLIVHLICAQLKTMFEQELQQFVCKKRLKSISDEKEKQDLLHQKGLRYNSQILPAIQTFIRNWYKSLPIPPSSTNKKEKKRKRSSSVQ